MGGNGRESGKREGRGRASASAGAPVPAGRVDPAGGVAPADVPAPVGAGVPADVPAPTSEPSPGDVPAPVAGAGRPVNAKGQPLPERWLAAVAVIWAGQAVSVFATCAASFAAIWYITETTSSAVWLSLASASSLLPVALLSPLGGVAADRFDRKLVMLVADGVAGLFSLALALLFLGGLLEPWLLLALLFVRAAAQAFHGPALTAAVPLLVPQEQLVRINSLDQSITSLSSIAGPALGIFLYGAWGLAGVMLFDALCAAAACACLAAARIPCMRRGGDARAGVWADMREGAAFIWRDRGLRSLMLLVMAAMLLFMPASSLSPLMVYEWFGGNGWSASVVEAVFGVGLLVGSAAVFAWGGGKRLVPLAMVGGVSIGLALAACGLLPREGFPAFAALMGVAAAAMQKRAPEDMLGRVMGIFMAGSSLAAPVGLAFSGFVAEAVGIRAWFLTCGILLVALFAAGALSRSIRALDAG